MSRSSSLRIVLVVGTSRTRWETGCGRYGVILSKLHRQSSSRNRVAGNTNAVGRSSIMENLKEILSPSYCCKNMTYHVQVVLHELVRIE